MTESHAREAERLRTATGRSTATNAIDAVVATFASACPRPIVPTSYLGDLAALTERAAHRS